MTTTCASCGHRPPLDGSFLFPPTMRNAEEIIDYWTRVEIPDEALARAQAVYRDNREALKREWPHHAWAWYGDGTWLERNPRPGADEPGELADWDRRLQADEDAYETALRQRLQSLPEALPREDVRPVFRAVAMLRASVDADLNWDEHRKIAEYLFQTHDGPRTVADIGIETGMLGLAHRFVRADLYDADGDGVIDRPASAPAAPPESMSMHFDYDKHREILEAVVEARFAEHERKLDESFDEIYRGLQTTAQVTIDANDIGRRRRR